MARPGAEGPAGRVGPAWSVSCGQGPQLTDNTQVSSSPPRGGRSKLSDMEQNEPRDTHPIDLPGPTQPIDPSDSGAAAPTQPFAEPAEAAPAPAPPAPGSTQPAVAAAAAPTWAVPSSANLGPAGPARGEGLAAHGVDPTMAGTPTLGPITPGPRSAVPVYRRRLVLGLGGAAATVLLIGAGFLAGQSFHRGDDTGLVSSSGARQAPGSHGPQNGPAGRSAGDSDGDGYGRLDGQGSNGSTSRGIVGGRVTAVSGSGLTLAGADGTSVKVTTTSSTVVAGVTGGNLSSISVGQVVLVRGTQATDGSVTATVIMMGPGSAGEHGGRGSGQQDQSGQQEQSGQQDQSGVAGSASQTAV
jgi:hypothetical protein